MKGGRKDGKREKAYRNVRKASKTRRTRATLAQVSSPPTQQGTRRVSILISLVLSSRITSPLAIWSGDYQQSYERRDPRSRGFRSGHCKRQAARPEGAGRYHYNCQEQEHDGCTGSRESCLGIPHAGAAELDVRSVQTRMCKDTISRNGRCARWVSVRGPCVPGRAGSLGLSLSLSSSLTRGCAQR
jgi:hypothetical protein